MPLHSQIWRPSHKLAPNIAGAFHNLYGDCRIITLLQTVRAVDFESTCIRDPFLSVIYGEGGIRRVRPALAPPVSTVFHNSRVQTSMHILLIGGGYNSRLRLTLKATVAFDRYNHLNR